jgi:hypothetical protein
MLESREKPYVLTIRHNEKLTMVRFRTCAAPDLPASLAPDEPPWAEPIRGSSPQSALECFSRREIAPETLVDRRACFSLTSRLRNNPCAVKLAQTA